MDDQAPSGTRLALDDDERYAFVHHLYVLGVAELMGREAPTDAGNHGGPAEVGARGGG